MRCAKTLRMREAANVFCSVFFSPITGIVPTPAVPHKVLSFIGSGGDDIIMCVSTVLFCVLSMCSICMTFHLLAGRGLCNCFDTHFTAKWHAKLRNAKTVFTHSFERTQATGRHTGMGKMEWMLFAFRTKVVITLGCCGTNTHSHDVGSVFIRNGCDLADVTDELAMLIGYGVSPLQE